MIKDYLRTEMKKKRRALTANEVSAYSRSISDKLFALDVYKNANVVMTYISAFKEPDTLTVIEKMSCDGKEIVVPVTHTDTVSIELSYFSGNLKKGAYGIYEPSEIVPAKQACIDLILVPGIAFDRRGNRIGFGMGYYDKLLCTAKCPKAALAYSFQITDNIDADQFDIPMNIIITENEVIYCDKT